MDIRSVFVLISATLAVSAGALSAFAPGRGNVIVPASGERHWFGMLGGFPVRDFGFFKGRMRNLSVDQGE